MGPEKFRIGWRVVAGAVSLPALFAARPALGQGFNASLAVGAVPFAIAFGAGGFALLAMTLLRRKLREYAVARARATEQIAHLRALVDEYEALLSGTREITVLWADNVEPPKILGQSGVILPPGHPPAAILDHAVWLPGDEAARLARALADLRGDGRNFDLSLRDPEGRLIRASGWVLGGGTVLRLRPAFAQPDITALDERLAAAEQAGMRTVLAALPRAAYLRDGAGRLVFANELYLGLAAAARRVAPAGGIAELLEPAALARHLEALGKAERPQTVALMLGERGLNELSEFPVSGGSIGLVVPRVTAPTVDESLGHISGIIDALATPIAIFNASRELVQCNRAYGELWGVDAGWLRPGMDERAILDKLRTEGALPNEPDYHAWRARHLTSYQLTAPSELAPWHLPDGRTLQVIAAPAGPRGGVVYVFEDITAQLTLKSQHRALLDVQRSTLNALSEGVAVFGTNGRLTLCNPRLSSLWKLPMNELGQTPHIDQIAAAAGRALPEDGAGIWRDLKRAIIDLSPNRSDRSGRIARADGKLIDYAVVRLPDGQSMMTFLDVTESANYQRVLKEKNEALLTADRLKDAFVQNVSYELRSPLTNIIGFADLLASESAGTLNERQRAYTDYIRASSVTLGVLIDNILDLATVDAGIAELRPEPQDIDALVEKARAGLAATFPEIDGEKALNLVVDIAPGLPPLVADGTRIVQVLYNLLSSAARFSEPGGEIRLAVAARGEHIVFTVTDAGTAMSEEMRAAMLERAETPVTGRQRGAGLGLAIVRAFVSLHGGTIAIERGEPRGSRVTVSLPRDAGAANATAAE